MAANNEVFDVANWLDRANGRTAAPQVARPAAVPAPVQAMTQPRVESYVPRHRADVPVDSVVQVA